MEKKQLRILVSLTKLCFIVIIALYPFLINYHMSQNTLNPLFITAILILFSLFILMDLFEKVRLFLLISAGFMAFYLFISFDKIFILAALPLLLDLLIYFQKPPLWGLLLFPFSLLNIEKEYVLAFILSLTGLCLIYHLIFVVIIENIKHLTETSSKEYELRNRLNFLTKKHSRDLMEATLKLDNLRLAELNTFSQSLHDKIGHSISGSLFKLEGAKLLMERDLEKSKSILDDVITLLRASMDEIRMILRTEKPKRSEVNINKLKILLNNFSSNYELETSFEYQGDLDKISPNQWSVMLENTVEALTNSLKYSNCSHVSVMLIVYNRIIRYQVKDNGNGTLNLVKGMGLSGMEERLATNGGSLNISCDHGFEVNMLIPL